MSIFAKKKRVVAGFLTTVCVAIGCSGIGAPVAAQELTPGCYERIYSAAHLSRQPAQVVGTVRMKIGGLSDSGARLARLAVVPVEQGHVRGRGLAGRVLRQVLYCSGTGGAYGCFAECDSGSFEVTRRSGTSITFRTDFLLVGEGGACGGMMDMAEVAGQAVSYRLDRVSSTLCDGM